MFGVVLRRIEELRREKIKCIGDVIAREYFPVFDVIVWRCEDTNGALGLALYAGYLAGLAPREAREEGRRLAWVGVGAQYVREFTVDMLERKAREMGINADIEGAAQALIEDIDFYYSYLKPATVEVAARTVLKVLRRLGVLDDGGGGVGSAAGAHGVYHT